MPGAIAALRWDVYCKCLMSRQLRATGIGRGSDACHAGLSGWALAGQAGVKVAGGSGG